jgi:hypothetical protein
MEVLSKFAITVKNLFGDEIIRTLGLYQPYASLMLHGKIESRWVKKGKKAPFPLGKYLIYSTKKAYSQKEFEHVAGDKAKHAWKLLENESTVSLNGYAICIGDLVKVEPMSATMEHKAFIDTPIDEWQSAEPIIINYHLLWALHFENIQRISPFLFKGKQGVGILTKEQHKFIQIL